MTKDKGTDLEERSSSLYRQCQLSSMLHHIFCYRLSVMLSLMKGCSQSQPKIFCFRHLIPFTTSTVHFYQSWSKEWLFGMQVGRRELKEHSCSHLRTKEMLDDVEDDVLWKLNERNMLDLIMLDDVAAICWIRLAGLFGQLTLLC
ncbi:uncharacterized protein LOC122950632 [Acropora millepora]|uniref:uncharacterized protein LOC122950632 n=1 Tax=Acropora millepora TaxID=45264 RepID=UPI001CF2D8D9|nr:uncharacterized protein LOC122950632 [Acropora millepora]